MVLISPVVPLGLILSEGFAPLDHKFLQVKEESLGSSFYDWIDSFKYSPRESCHFFFDQWQFKNSRYARNLFLPIDKPDRIYLIEHRRLLDIIYFVQGWVATEHDLPLSNEIEYVLASSCRIFDLKRAKQL